MNTYNLYDTLHVKIPRWREHPIGRDIKHLPPNQYADYVGMRHDLFYLFINGRNGHEGQ